MAADPERVANVIQNPPAAPMPRTSAVANDSGTTACAARVGCTMNEIDHIGHATTR